MLPENLVYVFLMGIILGMINIVLVDDHHIVRAGLKRILSEVSDFKVLGEAATAEEALSLVRRLKPHVVLMDIKMPGMGGIEATRKLLMQHACKVIILTSCNNDLYPQKLLKVGAVGYVTKAGSLKEMVRAIRAVNTGQRYISPEIASRLVLNQLDEHGYDGSFKLLSGRELQVVLMIVNGMSVHDIAEQLSLSTKTINGYRYKIFEKLSVRNDVELTLLAVLHRLIDPVDFSPKGHK